METAADVVRACWRAGIRLSADGDRIRPTPDDPPPTALLARLEEHRAEVLTLLAALPAPDRCEICGNATGWTDGKLRARCTACALAAAERMGLLPGRPEPAP